MLLTDYQTRLSACLKKLVPSEKHAALRHLAQTDLYFLLRHVLNRKDVERQWLFDRCREVQSKPNGYLDLWAREHYKSTIITYGLTIQDILKDPDVTIGIFSHTRPIAKGFLRQIKREFESNQQLKDLFPDIFYDNPSKQAVKWSEDDGIIVKRKSNPKESTVEAWGLVDGQPTSKHFKALVYDDVVVRESVTTPDMINKTTEALELSFNLGAEGGHKRFIGTRYHFNDSYKTVMQRGTAIPRIHTATEDGTFEGEPVLLTRERLIEKRRDQGPYTFNCQMLQNPVADSTQGFKREWLKHYDGECERGTNKYLLVDAANEKRKTSDYTSMWVVGLGQDGNYYVLDMIRDRLNITERSELVIKLHRKWKPLEVRYEKYGMMADVEFIKRLQTEQNYRFDIIEVGGQLPKADRIRRLVPIFEQGKMYLPQALYKTDYEKIPRELVNTFVEEEYMAFPVSIHDDMLDALARIAEPDLPLVWPQVEVEPERYKRTRSHGSAWAT
jgi:predicted phage terminase large subunit-like protein